MKNKQKKAPKAKEESTTSHNEHMTNLYNEIDRLQAILDLLMGKAKGGIR